MSYQYLHVFAVDLQIVLANLLLFCIARQEVDNKTPISWGHSDRGGRYEGRSSPAARTIRTNLPLHKCCQHMLVPVLRGGRRQRRRWRRNTFLSAHTHAHPYAHAHGRCVTGRKLLQKKKKEEKEGKKAKNCSILFWGALKRNCKAPQTTKLFGIWQTYFRKCYK